MLLSKHNHYNFVLLGVLGHEFLGVIEDIDEGNPKGLKKSQKVVGEINLACGACVICEHGGIPKRNHCPKRTVLGIIQKDGTFAEYLTLPVENIFLVPSTLSDERATFAEPLAAAYRIVEQVTTTSGDNIAVIGDGKLGNLIAQVMNFQPHLRVTLFGKHESKLAKVPQENVRKVLADDRTASTYENVFDICVEASGSASGIMMAAKITRPLGTIVLKTTCATSASDFNTAPFVVKELNIIGSRCGNFPMALEALNDGKIQVDQLIDKVFCLDKALEALEAAKAKGTMKVQLIMS